MSLARDNSISADLGRSNTRDQPAVPSSLNVMSPLVAIFDLTWIVLLGVAAGVLYDAAVRESQGRYRTMSVRASLLPYSIPHLVMRLNSIVRQISFDLDGRLDAPRSRG